jgi:WD40 repeat protein
MNSMKWSPDTKKFAYTGYRDTINYKELFLFLADSDGKVKTLKTASRNNPIGSICWSPDSSKIAYYQGITLTVLDVNSGSEKQLFTGGEVRSGIAWSADGKRILTVAEGGYGIVDSDSGSVRVIKCRAMAGYGPLFWSKDEKNALCYTSDYIFMVPVEEGSEPRIITGGDNGNVDGLCW